MQKVIPAILTQDPQELKERLELFRGKSQWMHIDIMDGTFVPGKTVNLFELGEASEFFNLEIHLMVADPFKYLEDCSGIRAKRVIFHSEAVREQEPMLSALGAYEFQKGIALNKETSLQALGAYAQKISSILLMGVDPGVQGRPFDEAVLPKIKKVKELYPNLLCGVDGGMGPKNIQSIFTNGADYAVVGSEIMRAEHPLEVFKSLEEMVQLTNAS